LKEENPHDNHQGNPDDQAESRFIGHIRASNKLSRAKSPSGRNFLQTIMIAPVIRSNEARQIRENSELRRLTRTGKCEFPARRAVLSSSSKALDPGMRPMPGLLDAANA